MSMRDNPVPFAPVSNPEAEEVVLDLVALGTLDVYEIIDFAAEGVGENVDLDQLLDSESAIPPVLGSVADRQEEASGGVEGHLFSAAPSSGAYEEIDLIFLSFEL